MSRSTYKQLLLLVLLLCIVASANGQETSWARKVWNNAFNDTTTSGKSKFIAYPVIGYTPETSWEFGVSGLYVFNTKKDIKNRLSELYGFTFLTLENQFGFWFDHAIYSDQNKYFFLGKFRLQQFPLKYHGIGVNTPDKPIARIDGFSLNIRERLLKELKNNLYFGIELDLNHLSSVVITEETSDFIKPIGNDGFTNLGFGLGIVYDQRYNVLNAREGFFLEGGFLRYNEALGSDFSFQNYFLDFRYYLPINNQQVLAFQFLANSVSTSTGNGVPFNQLSLMGGESLMRGFYLGRYRDNILLASQAEYRFLPFPFSKRFGGALFASIGGVSPTLPDMGLTKLRAAGGAGVRYLLFPNKDIYTRFDVAATNEGMGFYLYIGEAF